MTIGYFFISAIGGYYWLLVPILFVLINFFNVYSINVIDGYLLMAISSYFIGGYYINGYLWLFY